MSNKLNKIKKYRVSSNFIGYLIQNNTALTISLLVFFVLVVSLLASPLKSFWSDEVYSINFSRTLIHTAKYKDTNMMLFHLILHYWMRLGENELVLRILSTVFACATIPFIYLIGKKLFSKETGLISAILLSINVFFIAYAQEVRSYSLLFLLSAISTYYFVQIISKPTKKLNYLFYIIASGLSLYAHYFAIFLIITHFLYIIIFKIRSIKIKYLFTTGISLFLICIPIVLMSSLNSSQINWLPKPGLKNVIGLPFVLSGDFPPIFISYGLIVFYLIFKTIGGIKKSSINNEKIIKYLLIIFLLAIPPLITFSISFFIKPIVTSKYLIFCLLPLLILIGSGIAQIKYKKIKFFVMVMLILLAFIRLVAWFKDSNSIYWGLSNKKDDWKQIVKFTKMNAENRDGVTFLTYYYEEPFQFYNKNTSNPLKISEKTNYASDKSLLYIPNTNSLVVADFSSSKKIVWLIADNNSLPILRYVEGFDSYALNRTYSFERVQVFKFVKK